MQHFVKSMQKSERKDTHEYKLEDCYKIVVCCTENFTMAALGPLIREGFIKIPEVMTGCILGAIGLGIGAVGLIKKNQQEIKKPYKHNFVVVRDDDPKAAAYKQFYQTQRQ